jgi:hypothetical protein
MIADLSVHHVEGFILRAGHTGQRLSSDYGYDMLMFTYDSQGFAEPDFLFLQLKAAESWESQGTNIVFDLDIRDYHLWIQEQMPVILILFDASRKRANWLVVQNYFLNTGTRQPKKGSKTIRVRVPTRQVVNGRAVARWRNLKGAARRLDAGDIS